MEQAIKKAIESGYEPFRWVKIKEIDEWRFANALRIDFLYKNNSISLSPNDIFLDPLFWQAILNIIAKDNNGIPTVKKGASYLQHDFIDYLADGKDIEIFFNNLFTK